MDMDIRGRRLRFAAVSVLVVLTLTGFSAGRGRSGHGGSGEGGGGGCSSSSQTHGGSSSTSSGSTGDTSGQVSKDDYGDGRDHDHGTTGGVTSTSGSNGSSGTGGGSGAHEDGVTVKLLKCFSKKAPYAMVRLTNHENRFVKYPVGIDFEGKAGQSLASGTTVVEVPAKGVMTAKVKPYRPVQPARIAHCEVEDVVDR